MKILNFVEMNYEIALIASLILYAILPVYLGVFIVCSVIAIGRGNNYKQRLEEFLNTLSKVDNIATEDASPITRSRNRKRRGSG
jgi:hypothetical protein